LNLRVKPEGRRLIDRAADLVDDHRLDRFQSGELAMSDR
jgi:uncharacterized protein (DUF1778 family)